MLVRVAARLLLLFCRDAPDVAGLGPSPWPCAKPCTIHMFLENVHAVCLVEGKLHPACRSAALPCRGWRNAARDHFRGHRFLARDPGRGARSEEHTSELQSLMRISYA